MTTHKTEYYKNSAVKYYLNNVNHPKIFYIELREWLLGNDKNGFVLEHMWKLIFSQ